MITVRKILAVVAGYAIFVVSSIALFKFSGQNPHGDTTLTFQCLTAAYGIIFSVLSGWMVQIIAKTENLTMNFILAAIMAAFATFSFVKAEGAHWTQMLAILVFAPVSILGGMLYTRRKSGQR